MSKREMGLAGIVTRLKLDVGDREDLAAAIIDMLGDDRPEAAQERTVAEIISSLCSGQMDAAGGKERANDARRLGAAVLLAAVDRFLPKGSGHRDRTRKLLELCGSRGVVGLAFAGTVARFDLSGVRFSGCIFERVTWANCTFDETSVFDNCEILGGSAPHYCRGFGSADLASCRMDEEANAWVAAVRIAEGKRSYTAEDLKKEIQDVISKFIIRGGLGLKTVTERSLTRGTIGTSPNRDKIIDALKSAVLERHSISGTSESGYNVREESAEAIRFYAVNHVFTGSLAKALEILRADLGL